MIPHIFLHCDHLNNQKNRRAVYLKKKCGNLASLKTKLAVEQVQTLNSPLWLAERLHGYLMRSLSALLREM